MRAGLLLSLLTITAVSATGTADLQKRRYLKDKKVSFACAPGSTGCYDLKFNNFQLSEDALADTRSAIWADQPLKLDESFVMKTKILMDSPDGVGGEGMAFVIQTEGPDALGQAKGYAGITPSVAVEIDTTTEDAVVRITEVGPGNVLAGDVVVGKLEDLKIRSLRVEYDVHLKEMIVHLDQKEILRGDVNLETIFAGATEATWGFTASNGEEHTADQWVYFQKFENGPPADGSDSAESAESADSSDQTDSPTPATTAGQTGSPTQTDTPDQTDSPTPPIIYEPPPTPTRVVILTEDFNHEASQFVFQKNVFGEAGDPSNVLGEKSATRFGKWYDGVSTGGLRVTLYGASATQSISGAWEFVLELPEDVASADVSFGYKADMGTEFDANDYVRVFVTIDGTALTVENLAGGDNAQALWGPATMDLGHLSAGRHVIQIGAAMVTTDDDSGKSFVMRMDRLKMTAVPENINET